MPELPDLQAFSRNLTKKLAGKKVEKVHVIYTKKLDVSETELRRAIEGATLRSIYREGKQLYFQFSNGNVLALHMMLKGQLRFFQDTNDHKHTILQLLFDDGTGLALTDFQKQATPALNPLPAEAPDAISPDAGYRFLKKTLNSSRTAIKKLLMDQKIIRGIGNAYADEILWHAGISPFSVSNKIPDDAIRKLARSIKTVFAKAEKAILKAEPGIIGGEIRDFLDIHNPDRTHSPTGAKIITDESFGRKTYYTKEQQLWN